MSFIKEFKEFAVKGNLIDFAIGVVVGGAFGKVTTAFVDGMVMPVVGKLIAKNALEAGIKEVVFDRNGYLYHGRVKQLADAAREGGLKF